MPKSNPDKDLITAIDSGEPARVREALAKGGSPNAKKGKQTAIEYAFSRRTQDEAILALIDAGADIAPVKGVIVWAVTQSPEVLEKFLAAGADPNTETFSGRPVQVAARAGLLPQVKRLIAAGADLDAGTLIGNALTDAIRDGHIECALELLRAGAKPAAAERFGPLVPVLIELGDVDLVRALLDAGANPNARYTLKGPHSRVKKAERDASRGGLIKSLKAISDAVAEPETEPDVPPFDDSESYEDMQDRINAEIQARIDAANRVRFSGATPLMIAASEGLRGLVELLLDRGAVANAIDDSGRSAMAIAELSGQTAVAELLRARGGAVVAAVPPGQALFLAAERGDAAGIESAVGGGAKVNDHDTRKSADGKTALGLAVEHGPVEAVKVLLALGADLELKAKTSPSNTKAFIDNESQERTPLHVAAALGRDDIAAALIDAGALLKARDEYKETPLHLAATENRASTVRLLLERGAEIDAKGRDSMTALLYAAARGHVEVGELLLEAGADPMAATRAKETALHYAVSSRSVALARSLVERGADPDAKNKYGSSARERGGHIEGMTAAFAAPRKPAAAPIKPKPPKGSVKRPRG